MVRNSKVRRLVAVLGLASIGSWLASPAALAQLPDCLPNNLGTTTFPLFCRGPLAVQVLQASDVYLVDFQRNPTGVGGSGTSNPLFNGSCAFADRAVSTAEPAEIELVFLRGPGGSFSYDPVYNAITTCNANAADCVFVICVGNDNGGELLAAANAVTLPIKAPRK